MLIGDAELEALRSQLADLRKVEAEVFQKPGLTDQQRLVLATRAAQRATASWQTRLEKARKGVFGDGKTKTPVSSPELAALRAQAKAAVTDAMVPNAFASVMADLTKAVKTLTKLDPPKGKEAAAAVAATPDNVDMDDLKRLLNDIQIAVNAALDD